MTWLITRSKLQSNNKNKNLPTLWGNEGNTISLMENNLYQFLCTYIFLLIKSNATTVTSTLDKSHMVLAIIICTITKCSNLMLDRWHLMITTWWQWQSLMMSQETTSLIARQGHCALGHIAAFCTLFVWTNQTVYCRTICTNYTTKSKFYVAQDCGYLLVPDSIVLKVCGYRQTMQIYQPIFI